VDLVESGAPARLGRSFRWLLGSVVVANIGDGIALAAGPLLVASETRDPLLVAAALFLQQLPWLLFGVLAGAYVDRLDRRRMVVAVDTARAAVLVALTATIATGTVNIALVLATMFVLGTAETFSDLASQTLLVGTVQKADLGIGNARLQGGFLVTNQLAGPPIGAFLFALARSWPFAATAACYLLGAVLVSRIVLRRDPAAERQERRSVRAEVAEGMRWLWNHPPIRTLAITIVLFNVTFGAAWAVLVLYAQERLGLSEAGYGWLITAGAVGGLVGTAAYGWLEEHVGLADLMRIGLVLETLTHLALALTSTAWVALIVMFVFGAHAFVWGTTSRTVRQRAVPDALQGRVGSVYMIGVVGGMLVGTPIGGAIARQWGITAPFWFGFVGSALLVVAMWRELRHIAREAEEPADATAT
jgi:predicted MFS family arabinose efflux permease